MSGTLTDRSALVVGGTAGIGAAIAKRLAQQGASVTVAGRNAEAGAAVVAEMQEAGVGSSGRFGFERLDASSLQEVRRFATELRATHATLDLLVMCQSKASFGGREETVEGLEMKLTLHAYSRFLLAEELLPALQRGEGARVLSVLSGGVHRAFTDWGDADLKTKFSLRRAADAAGFYNDVGFQRIADDPAAASVGFLHAAPGFVASRWGHDTGAAVLIKLGQKLFAKSPEECAEILVGALVDPRYATGFHCVDEHGEPTTTTPEHTAANMRSMAKHWRAVRERALHSDDVLEA